MSNIQGKRLRQFAVGLVLALAGENLAHSDNTSPRGWSSAGLIERERPVVQLSFALSGVVQDVLVDEGEEVVKGQLLASIDCASYQATRQKSLADLDAANANRSLVLEGSRREERDVFVEHERRATASRLRLEAAYQRLLHLKRQGGHVSDDDLEQAELELGEAVASESHARAERLLIEAAPRRAEVESAEATVAARRAAYLSADTDVRRCHVRAPANGVILEKTLDAGAVVSSVSPEPILRFLPAGRWRIRAEVDESDILGPKLGQRAQVSAAAWRPQVLEATVVRILPYVDRRGTRSQDGFTRVRRKQMVVFLNMASCSEELCKAGLEVTVRVPGNSIDGELPDGDLNAAIADSGSEFAEPGKLQKRTGQKSN